MIHFDHVCKRYPNGRDAVSDLTLEVVGGEMVFLTGHSGAGKSTLLKLIALIERPSRGTLVVNGSRTCTAAPPQIPAFRRQIGVVFQDHKLLHGSPGLRQRRAAAHHCRRAPPRIGKRVRAALDQVGLLGSETCRAAWNCRPANSSASASRVPSISKPPS